MRLSITGFFTAFFDARRRFKKGGELPHLPVNIVFITRLDYQAILRPLHKMNFTDSYPPSPYFKHRGRHACILILNLKTCPPDI